MRMKDHSATHLQSRLCTTEQARADRLAGHLAPDKRSRFAGSGCCAVENSGRPAAGDSVQRLEMTLGSLLDWVSATWRAATSRPERRTSAIPLQPPATAPAEYPARST